MSFYLALVAALLTPPFSRWLCARTALVKPNFRGERIPAACGLAFLPVALAIAPISPAALVAFCFGWLGLLDDLYGDRSVGGFRGHLRALFSGRVTTGALKLLGGGLVALLAAYFNGGLTPALVIDALLIALAANTLNLLDLRPGRACFGFALLAAPSLALSRPVALLPLLVVFLLEWRSDARARSMLGDTGANFLGALAGALAMETLPLWARALLLALLLSLNLASERVSITQCIARTPWLAALDRRLGVR